MRWLVFVLAVLAAPAFGNESAGCQDIWFTRNLVMDRAGYCFGSSLGQALFDNAGCTGSEVAIDAASKRLVDEIRALEAEHGCAVNTSRTTLDIDDIEIRRRLVDLPIFDEFEGGCLGWTGPPTPLYAGHNRGSAVLGRIDPGDYVSLAHVGVDGGTYVTTYVPVWGALRSGGWLMYDGKLPCADFAG